MVLNKTPKVSIVCISYNQEKYIEQTIEGFLAQKTNFDIEIIISDDASTDSTATIIDRYYRQNPEIIKVNLRAKNVGVHRNLYEAIRMAKGKYIALCEGDDFWTDSNKLQHQADYMDGNPDVALCFHRANVFYEDKSRETEVFPDIDTEISVEHLIVTNFIQTNTVMYRATQYDNLPMGILPIDHYLHLYHAKLGKIGFLPQIMSSYRRHEGGIWWSSSSDDKSKFWIKHGVSHIELYNEILKLFGDDIQLQEIIKKKIAYFVRSMVLSGFETDKLIENVFHKHSYVESYYIVAVTKEIDDLIKSQKKSIETIERKNQEILSLKNQNHELDVSLNSIKKSKTYRLGRFVLFIPQKIKQAIKQIHNQ